MDFVGRVVALRPQLHVAVVDPDEALQGHLVAEPRDHDVPAPRLRRAGDGHDVAVLQAGPRHAVPRTVSL